MDTVYKILMDDVANNFNLNLTHYERLLLLVLEYVPDEFITQSYISDLVGCSRMTVNKYIQRLYKKGYLIVEKNPCLTTESARGRAAKYKVNLLKLRADIVK